MRSQSFEGMACSIAGVLDAVGDRWAILILRDLSLGLSKYEDLRKSTDVTHATLSDRLKHLEESELIERRQYQSGPDRGFEQSVSRAPQGRFCQVRVVVDVFCFPPGFEALRTFGESGHPRCRATGERQEEPESGRPPCPRLL